MRQLHETTLPSGSLDPVPSSEQVRAKQLAVKLAVGAVFDDGSGSGTVTFRENSEVLPAGSVAVDVTTFPWAGVDTGIANDPAVLATADARNVRPSPEAPLGPSAMNSSTVQLAHADPLTALVVAELSSGTFS